MQRLDLSLEQIDTEKVHANFDSPLDDFTITGPDNLDWNNIHPTLAAIARERKLDELPHVSSVQDVSRLLELLWETLQHELTSDIYLYYLESLRDASNLLPGASLWTSLLLFLESSPENVVHVCNMYSWVDVPSWLLGCLRESAISLLRGLILSSSTAGELVIARMRTILQGSSLVTAQDLKELFRLISLTVPSTELGMNIILEGLEPCSTRVVLDTPRRTAYLLRNLTGITLDHIESGSDQLKARKEAPKYPWKLESAVKPDDKGFLLPCALRIDAPRTARPAPGDHVRFTSITKPSDMASTTLWVFDAIVERSEGSEVLFRCVQRPPPCYRKCWWAMDNLGSFVTSETMMEAVVDLMVRKDACCKISGHLFPSRSNDYPGEGSDIAGKMKERSNLNPSQNEAITIALQHPLSLIWGPPGTGKTHTIVAICEELLEQKETKRLLVTAPTHNAVDNVMRQCIARSDLLKSQALRVSTDVCSSVR